MSKKEKNRWDFVTGGTIYYHSFQRIWTWISKLYDISLFPQCLVATVRICSTHTFIFSVCGEPNNQQKRKQIKKKEEKTASEMARIGGWLIKQDIGDRTKTGSSKIKKMSFCSSHDNQKNEQKIFQHFFLLLLLLNIERLFLFPREERKKTIAVSTDTVYYCPHSVWWVMGPLNFLPTNDTWHTMNCVPITTIGISKCRRLFRKKVTQGCANVQCALWPARTAFTFSIATQISTIYNEIKHKSKIN